MEGFFQPNTVGVGATSDAIASRTATAAATPSPTATTAATPSPTATTAATRYLAWVLLEDEAYYNDCENGTTAEVKTSTGHIVKVTFFLTDPPAISHFCVHGAELEHGDFDAEPRVVFSEKDLVLLRFAFTIGPHGTLRQPHLAEYFVYKAGPRKPSLTPIPATCRPDKAKSYPAILPCKDDDENFVVADLAMTRNLGHFVLHIFSSKTKKWITKPLQLQASPVVTNDLPSLPDKVIALGADTIGWIDLWRGIVVCNVFDPDPVMHFIPLPKPEFNLSRDGTPQPFRDVSFCNGFIKFMEIYHCTPHSFDSDKVVNFKTMKDLDYTDVIYDSELFFQNRMDLMEDEPSFVDVTWKIRTCYRHTSWNLWCKGHTAHVDDIMVNNPRHYMMLPKLWDGSIGKHTLRNLVTGYPTLGIHGDVVYLVTKVGLFDDKAWVVGVDLGKKTVEVLEPYSANRCRLSQTSFLACTFSGYMNATARSCVSEDSCDQNYLLNGYFSLGLTSGFIIQNNLQNIRVADGYCRSIIQHGDYMHPGFNGYTFQPQLVLAPHSVQHTIVASSESGCPRSVRAQSTYPVLGTDAHGRLWFSVPVDNPFQPQLPLVTASSPVPLNTLMDRVPLPCHSTDMWKQSQYQYP